jgi:outer membrane receptor protein involved in Fe transport
MTVQPCTILTPGGICTVTGPALTGNDIAGFNPSAPLAGATDVAEVFGELLIPIISEVPGIELLELSLAGRRSEYSTVDGVSTYKADLSWTIVPGLRLRGGYQEAIRAPSVGELFAPVLLGFPNIGNPVVGGAPSFSGDPCDVRGAFRQSSNPDAADVRQLCLDQGVPAAVIDTYTYTNQQVPGLSGGNPGLEEETANTFSVGLVFSPSFGGEYLERLNIALDYYNIEITNAVGTISAADQIQLCYNRQGANPTFDLNNAFCQLFQRDPLSGNIINPLSTNQNLAANKTSGVDFQINWGMDVGPGSLDLGFVGTWLETFESQANPIAPIENRTGTIGNGVALSFPEWKWLATVDYSVGDARIGVRWRHIGEQVDFLNPADEIPAIGYFDILGRYDVTDNLTFRINVNNIMDEQPPTYGNSVQANTDPSTYDVLGRRFTIGFTGRF